MHRTALELLEPGAQPVVQQMRLPHHRSRSRHRHGIRDGADDKQDVLARDLAAHTVVQHLGARPALHERCQRCLAHPVSPLRVPKTAPVQRRADMVACPGSRLARHAAPS